MLGAYQNYKIQSEMDASFRSREKIEKYFPETDIMDAKHKERSDSRTVQANGSLARTTDHLVQIPNLPDASALTIAMENKANQKFDIDLVDRMNTMQATMFHGFWRTHL